MAWNEKYWDMICNIFLTPEYMGFKPIKWQDTGNGSVTIARASIEKGANALYSRVPMSRAEDIRDLISHKEEILNHVFNLTFAIAGDEILQRLFCEPLGLEDKGPFRSLGREVREIYDLPDNVTQQDGFFVTDQSAVGVELKLGSVSSAGQLLKYIMLFLLEEKRQNRRLNFGLVFIIPENSRNKHWQSIGLSGPRIDRTYIDRLDDIKLNKHMQRFLKDHRDQVADALSRLRIISISWTEFDHAMASLQTNLRTNVCGEQTVSRLLEGLRVQISAHKGTGVIV